MYNEILSIIFKNLFDNEENKLVKETNIKECYKIKYEYLVRENKKSGFMGILDLFGKKDVSPIAKKVPFDIKTSFNPVRISSHKIDRCDLEIKIKNMTNETVLTSLVIEVGNNLGLDQTGIHRTKEIRVGYLNKGDSYTIIVPIWSNSTTPPGNAPVKINAYVHYRTYSYILNGVKKDSVLRVV